VDEKSSYPVETEDERHRRVRRVRRRELRTNPHRRPQRDDDDPDPDAEKHRVRIEPLWTKKDVARRLNYNNWTVDRLRKIDPTFPTPIWLGPVTPRWRPADVELWIETRRRGGVAQFSQQQKIVRRRREVTDE
jgi:predicted DNA-binding transcriptional regulator AlpA